MRPATPPQTPDELRRVARALRCAAGELEAAAREHRPVEAAWRTALRMAAPLLQWGQGNAAQGEG